LDYIENASFSFDCVVMARTVASLFVPVGGTHFRSREELIRTVDVEYSIVDGAPGPVLESASSAFD